MRGIERIHFSILVVTMMIITDVPISQCWCGGFSS